MPIDSESFLDSHTLVASGQFFVNEISRWHSADFLPQNIPAYPYLDICKGSAISPSRMQLENSSRISYHERGVEPMNGHTNSRTVLNNLTTLTVASTLYI